MRVSQILGTNDLAVTSDSKKTYTTYLKSALSLPCQLVAAGEFEWEDFDEELGMDDFDFDEAGEQIPLSSDEFIFIKFCDEPEDFVDGIENYEQSSVWIRVERTSDAAPFTMRLQDLKAADENSPNYQLIDDFSTWIYHYE